MSEKKYRIGGTDADETVRVFSMPDHSRVHGMDHWVDLIEQSAFDEIAMQHSSCLKSIDYLNQEADRWRNLLRKLHYCEIRERGKGPCEVCEILEKTTCL